MKKLLDESTDELTRALLKAGATHRPPKAGRVKLLVALGLGGGLGLWGSKASAWLGSGAGKLVLVGMAVGVAGGLYAVTTRNTDPSSIVVAPGKAGSPLASTPPPNPVQPSEAEAASVKQVSRSVATPTGDGLRTEPSRQTPGAKATRHARPSPLTAPVEVTEKEVTPPAQPPALDAEVALVDALRLAVVRHDSRGAEELLVQYRVQFPHGQLQEEVVGLATELRARLVH